MPATLHEVSLIQPGTSAQTLATNGSGVVVWTSFLKTDIANSQVLVNSPTSPSSGIPLIVKAGTGAGLEVESETATDNSSINVNNTALSNVVRVGIAGSSNAFVTGSAQSDAVFQHLFHGKRIWISSKVLVGDANTTAIMVLDQAGVVIGSTAAAGAKHDVFAGTGLAGRYTGVSGQQTVQIIGIGGSGVPTLTVQADSNQTVQLISTGAAVHLAMRTDVSPTNGVSAGLFSFQGKESATSTNLTGVRLFMQGAETWNATSAGANFIVQTVATGGSTTLVNRFQCYANGSISLNASASALTTGATNGHTGLPSCAGPPTGTPALAPTGVVWTVVDSSNQKLMGYLGGAWVNFANQATAHHVHSITNLVAAGGGSSSTGAATVDYFTADTSSGGNYTLTLPGATTRGAKPIHFRNLSGGLASFFIARGGSDTINGATTSLTLAAGQCVTLIPNGTDWQTIGRLG